MKDIPGFEGRYAVTEDGRVWGYEKRGIGIGKGRWKKERWLPLRLGRGGYMYTSLNKNSTQSVFSVHRIVALTYIPNPNCLPQVNHKDGNKHNNSLSNLEWCTPKENTAHALLTGLKAVGEQSHNSILKKSEVEYIKKNYKPHVVTQISLARKFSVSREAINGIINGRNWKQ